MRFLLIFVRVWGYLITWKSLSGIANLFKNEGIKPVDLTGTSGITGAILFGLPLLSMGKSIDPILTGRLPIAF